MRAVLLLVFLCLSGAIAGMIGGFLAGVLFVWAAAGATAMAPSGLSLAMASAVLGLKFATLPAVLLGGLLWYMGISSKWAWAGAGVLAGWALYAVLRFVPGVTDMLADPILTGPDRLLVGTILAAGGAVAALVFRVTMGALARKNAG